ncbi:unnamed protein product, partial [Prorocentrum cordatum]
MKAPPKAAETATTPTEPPRLPAEAVSAHAPPSSGRLARLTARASRPCRDRALRAMDNQNGHLCRQFQAGHCRRGAECPLAHELPVPCRCRSSARALPEALACFAGFEQLPRRGPLGTRRRAHVECPMAAFTEGRFAKGCPVTFQEGRKHTDTIHRRFPRN